METNDRYGNYRKSVRQFPFLGRKYAGPIWILQFLEPWIRVITGCTCVKQLELPCHISINFNALKYEKKGSFYIYLYSKYQAKMSGGIVFDMYKTLSCKSLFQKKKKKKKKKNTYLPISQMVRSTANIHFFKADLIVIRIRGGECGRFNRAGLCSNKILKHVAIPIAKLRDGQLSPSRQTESR